MMSLARQVRGETHASHLDCGICGHPSRPSLEVLMLLQRIAREPAHQHPLLTRIVRNYTRHAAANTARRR
jgi:hypothetical protein